jgi:hypothetical protein
MSRNSNRFYADGETVIDPVPAFRLRQQKWVGALAFGGALAVASTGHADDGAAGAAGNEPWSDAEQHLRPARQVDAHSDRIILMPTAETQPEGTFFISSYELVLLQLGYAITDDVQLSALVLPPLFQEQPFFVSPTLKINLARGAGASVAVLGGVDVLAATGDDNGDSAFLGRIGAVGQLCITSGCRSSLSANALFWARLDAEGSALVTSVGGVFRVSDVAALLLEPTLAVPTSGDISDDLDDGLVVSYGVRLSGPSFAFDLTLVRPFIGGAGDIFVLGLPFVVATYRTN